MNCKIFIGSTYVQMLSWVLFLEKYKVYDIIVIRGESPLWLIDL